jgi:hypothetical protein
MMEVIIKEKNTPCSEITAPHVPKVNPSLDRNRQR